MPHDISNGTNYIICSSKISTEIYTFLPKDTNE